MGTSSETRGAVYGVGFRAPHYEWVTTQRPSGVEIFEIVSDNFLGVGGRPRHYLDKLRADYPVLMHGVGLSIGSHKAFDPDYLRQLKTLADGIEAPLVSDHLSWGHLGDFATHDLLPIVYTEANLRHLVERLDRLQTFLGRRFYLENPSAYVAFKAGDYSEAEFFVELLQRSGAGLLLDLNNLYVNQRNLGQDPEDFLRRLKPEHIGYFHLAGHSEEGAVLVDTHDRPVPDVVWSLFAKAKALFPAKPAIVEWDGQIPEFSRLVAECVKARELQPQPLADTTRPPAGKTEPVPRDELRIYRAFYGEIVRPEGISERAEEHLADDRPTPARVGMRVYNHAYFSRLDEGLRAAYPALAFLAGDRAFSRLTVDYLTARPPRGHTLDTVNEGLSLFLKDEDVAMTLNLGVPRRVLADLAALEWAQCEVATAEDEEALRADDIMSFTAEDWEKLVFTFRTSERLVETQFAVLPVLEAALRQEAPERPEAEPSLYWVSREEHASWERRVDGEEALLLRTLARGARFIELVEALSSQDGFLEAEAMQKAASWLMQMAAGGHVAKPKADQGQRGAGTL